MGRVLWTGFSAGLVIALMMVSGCQKPPPPKKISSASIYDQTEDPDCYTVDLFSANDLVAPVETLPPEWALFAGRWGGGAWGGVWCHDLHVLEVRPDGSVLLIEAHAPYEPWGKRATAFKRTGRIGEDGHLRILYGKVEAEYWIQNGRMLGSRNEGAGPMIVALRKRT